MSSSLRSLSSGAIGAARCSSATRLSTSVRVGRSMALHQRPYSHLTVAVLGHTSPLQNMVNSQPHAITATRRSFSITHVSQATLAAHPPGDRSELVYYPTPESLRAMEEEDGDDYDIDLLPLEEVQLRLTERAAEVCFHLRHRQVHPCIPLFDPAITTNSGPGEQSQRRSANIGGEWGMSWLSVQDGACERPKARRLVRCLFPSACCGDIVVD